MTKQQVPLYGRLAVSLVLKKDGFFVYATVGSLVIKPDGSFHDSY